MANPLHKVTALFATPAPTAAAQPAAAHNPGQAIFGQVAPPSPAPEVARGARPRGRGFDVEKLRIAQAKAGEVD